jgi:Zn-dependent peptidase ImmA (M78 family)/transcriptional regulator with XRE-family HTH domain
MARVEALIKPELLVWARKSVSLSEEEAADRLKLSVDRLVAWESGKSRPTVAQLRKVANLYKRPLAVFYLPAPPKDFDAMKSFRRHPNREFAPPSLELAYQVREAEMHREVLLELAASAGERLPPFGVKATTDDAPGTFAARLRERLGITVEQQERWGSDYDALHAWRRAIEDLGVLVFQVSRVRVEEMRGFCIAHHAMPIIAVNSGDAVRARIFSLLHELTHLALGHGELCNVADSAAESRDDDNVEVFCNEVAGEVLVPFALLDAQADLPRRGTASATIPADAVHALAARLKVSEEVVLLRLLGSGRITRDAYLQRRRVLQALAPAKQKKKGGPAFHVKVVANLGKPYVRTVLDALHTDRITLSDVSDYLGIKVNHLPKIEGLVLRDAAAGADA